MAVAWNKLGRPAEARRLLVEARRTLARHDLDPLLGSLVGQAEAACEAVAGLSEPLTPRELEILRLLAAVQSLNDIAAALVVSVNTVKSHVRSIYSKLRVTSRRDAVRRAAELGLIESPRT